MGQVITLNGITNEVNERPDKLGEYILSKSRAEPFAIFLNSIM